VGSMPTSCAVLVALDSVQSLRALSPKGWVKRGPTINFRESARTRWAPGGPKGIQMFGFRVLNRKLPELDCSCLDQPGPPACREVPGRGGGHNASLAYLLPEWQNPGSVCTKTIGPVAIEHARADLHPATAVIDWHSR